MSVTIATLRWSLVNCYAAKSKHVEIYSILSFNIYHLFYLFFRYVNTLENLFFFSLRSNKFSPRVNVKQWYFKLSAYLRTHLTIRQFADQINIELVTTNETCKSVEPIKLEIVLSIRQLNPTN